MRCGAWLVLLFGCSTTRHASEASLVQVMTSVSTNGFEGLQTTAGDMVLVVRGGAPVGDVPCTTSSISSYSTPNATWQVIDQGPALCAFVACNAPSITSLALEGAGGAEPVAAVLSEWKGIASVDCYVQGQTGSQCTKSSSSWSNDIAGDTRSYPQLVVAAGMTDSDATWSASAPFELQGQTGSAGNSVSAFIASDDLKSSSAPPPALGTVSSWTNDCYSDLLAFEVAQ